MKAILVTATTAIIVFSSMAPAPTWAQTAEHGIHHGPATTQAPTAPLPAGPSAVAIEFENEVVLVLRVRMEPHEQTPMHDLVNARIVVWLTDTHLRDTTPDGRSNEIHRGAGAVDWVPPQRHAGENLGDMPIEWLAIVPKTKAPASR
jgi:hypothetical protein